MIPGDKPKWTLTFVCLGLCAWWFGSKHGFDNAFAGALITWAGLCVQYWMRKKAKTDAK